MAQAIIVTLQKDLPPAVTEYARTATGKALARESERLETAARASKATSLSSLLSESQAALIAQMKEEGFDPSKMRLPPEQWYPPAEGLKTVRALTNYVTANLNNFKQPNPILRDLKAAEALLAAAEVAGVMFHFSRVHV